MRSALSSIPLPPMSHRYNVDQVPVPMDNAYHSTFVPGEAASSGCVRASAFTGASKRFTTIQLV
eukprot:84290-Lingulodinium_polyedra.AAC.1